MISYGKVLGSFLGLSQFSHKVGSNPGCCDTILGCCVHAFFPAHGGLYCSIPDCTAVDTELRAKRLEQDLKYLIEMMPQIKIQRLLFPS